MKKRIGEVMSIAPWTELNFEGERFEWMKKMRVRIRREHKNKYRMK